MKVLIIDDEDDTRSIASMSLSILGGVDVVEAEGGLEGIAKAEQDRPDVILLDMMMPGMDGSQTLIELQKNPRTLDIPVIFLTAKAMNSEVDRLVRMGAIAVLTKPFDPTTLAAQVEQILESRGLKVTPSTVSHSETDYNSNAPVETTPAPPPLPSNEGMQNPFARMTQQSSANSPQNSGSMPQSPNNSQGGVPTAQTGGLISISRTSMFTGMNTGQFQVTPPGGSPNSQQPLSPLGQNQQAQWQPQNQTGGYPQAQSNPQSALPQSQSQNLNWQQATSPQSQQEQRYQQGTPPYSPTQHGSNQQPWLIQGGEQQNQHGQPLTPQQQQWIAQQSITSDYAQLPARPSTDFSQNFPQRANDPQPPYTVPSETRLRQGPLPGAPADPYSEQQKKLRQSETSGYAIPGQQNTGGPQYQPLVPQYEQHEHQGSSGPQQAPITGQHTAPQYAPGTQPASGYQPINQQSSANTYQPPGQSNRNSSAASTNKNNLSSSQPENVADPWVLAANENVQTSSAKSPPSKGNNTKVAPENPVVGGNSNTNSNTNPTPPPLPLPLPATSSPAAIPTAPTVPLAPNSPPTKPIVIKARPPKEEQKESERKKFSHPWGQIQKPDWSGEADPLADSSDNNKSNDQPRDPGSAQKKRSNDDKK